MDFKNLDSKNLITKLGLNDFINTFKTYFSREFLNTDGILNNYDLQKLQNMILSLESNPIPVLPKVKCLDSEIVKLKKNASLHLKDIFEFMKIIKLFFNISKLENIKDIFLKNYIETFKFPNEIINLLSLFDFKNSNKILKNGADAKLDSYILSLESKKKQKENELYLAMNIKNLQEFLVDSNIHFVENQSCLLLRAGYSNVLNAKIIARSAHGFFYIVPLSIENLQQQIYALEDKIEARMYELSKEYSKILTKHILFVKFINNEFDFIDSANARILFAKDYNFEFVFPVMESKLDSIIIAEYSHPNLNKPKPISINIQKKLLMITGVNAGGKTMLLKSILSALFCAKNLIPMKINAAKSNLAFFKHIAIIAQDPQDSKNDISTFSGRICEIVKFLNMKDLILGIDEIEIGTDSNEAACLYKVILEHFLTNKVNLIVTTHHKSLVSLMADNSNIELKAAMYDYKNAKPTFSFMDGIGKSYALECAKQYGIPKEIIKKAKEIYGENANKLEKLIETSNSQITQNKAKELELQNLIAQNVEKEKKLDSMKIELENNFKTQSLELKRHYNEAIKELKMLAKKGKNLESNITKEIHKTLNKSHKKQEMQPKINIESSKDFKINSWVKYKGKIAKVISKDSTGYTIQTIQNNIKIKKIKAIELENTATPESKGDYNLQMQVKPSTKIDLHGMTKDEALENLESFFSNALAARFSEVEVVHGIGSGTLKKLVENFLDSKDFIRGYNGNMIKKIVYLF